MDDFTPRAKIRVYHRTDEDLVLAWSRKDLFPDHIKNVTVMYENRVVNCSTVMVDGSNTKGITEPSVLGYVNQTECGIDPYKDIQLTVILGGKDSAALTKVLNIHKAGVLPGKEKDRKAARAHLMGWDPETEMWTKIPLVKTENGFAVPVVIVERK